MNCISIPSDVIHWGESLCFTAEGVKKRGKKMRTVISLDQDWDFVINPVKCTPPFQRSAEEAQRVCIPHCWNAKDGQNGENYYRG